MPDGLCGMHIVAADMIEMSVAESFIVCSTHRYLSPVAWGAWGAEVSFLSVQVIPWSYWVTSGTVNRGKVQDNVGTAGYRPRCIATYLTSTDEDPI